MVSAETDAQDVQDMTADADNTTTTVAPDSTVAVATTTSRSPQRFFKPNEKTLHVLISKWLMTQGISLPACASGPFEEMMHGNRQPVVSNAESRQT
ncbi:hypothetical protein PHMEG_0001467 [Phytophthora megakarya]|uniref:Uncharacterized protein n=1 Tax=Phytophthora megakarya TaxID=4795 RepID=A0A225X0E7_9STRA|nr:hypothetical protein PHMEG_0001467 [Phytophthora megakarya]